mmetsp:Transcript_11814/g.33676  ORF Transcript_11814/g.33676 Transcript_11814/m.33676 type:complete len:269 (-) Transcript_11814:446-1252(-)
MEARAGVGDAPADDAHATQQDVAAHAATQLDGLLRQQKVIGLEYGLRSDAMGAEDPELLGDELRLLFLGASAPLVHVGDHARRHQAYAVGVGGDDLPGAPGAAKGLPTEQDEDATGLLDRGEQLGETDEVVAVVENGLLDLLVQHVLQQPRRARAGALVVREEHGIALVAASRGEGLAASVGEGDGEAGDAAKKGDVAQGLRQDHSGVDRHGANGHRGDQQEEQENLHGVRLRVTPRHPEDRGQKRGPERQLHQRRGDVGVLRRQRHG